MPQLSVPRVEQLVIVRRELMMLTLDDLFSWAIVWATPGNRNQTGFLLARRLRNQGSEEWGAEEILRDYAA